MNIKSTAIAFILLLSMLFTACADKPAASPIEPVEPDTTHDFSVYLSGIGDPIRLNTLIDEYEHRTGLDIEVVTAENASDRTLWRRLNAQDPPSVFTVDTGTDIGRIADAGIIALKDGETSVEEIQSAMPVRLDTGGFAADKALLADLIGEKSPDRFIADLKASDYREWHTFISALSKYIEDGSVADFKLNRRVYRFEEEKGALAAGLTGVFAVSGSDLSFLGRGLFDRALATTDPSAWTASAAELAAEAEAAIGTSESAIASGAAVTSASAISSGAVAASDIDKKASARSAVKEQDTETTEAGIAEVPEPSEADVLVESVVAAYTAALAEITQNIAGLYAPGIRGDDFIDREYYSREGAERIFTAGKAVFMDVSADRGGEEGTSYAQSPTLSLLPVKIQYRDFGLDTVTGGVAANSAAPVRVTKALCINESLTDAQQEQARDFAEWFVKEENYGGNAFMREAAVYLERGDILPYRYGAADCEALLSRFDDTISRSSGLPLYLTEPDWDTDRLTALRGYLKAAWRDTVG